MNRGVFVLSASAFLCMLVLADRTGSAADIRGTLANGWERHSIGGKGVQLAGVYAGDSGFLALGNESDWVSGDGRRWKPAPRLLAKYALSQHIPDLNLVRVGITGGVKGYTDSVKAEGPNGGYIAVGSYQPPGQPVTKTRAEVATSTDGVSWRMLPDKSKAFADAAMTDVARGGPGWLAVGYSVGPEAKPVIWESADSVRWQRIARQPAVRFYNELARLLHGPAGLLAVATGLDGPAQVWASSDGLHWKASPDDSFGGGILQQVTAGGPGYLAVGGADDDPALWASSDGLRWRRVAGADAFPGDLTLLQGVAFRGHTGVVVGQYTTVKIGRFGVQPSPAVPSGWTWTPQSSALTPTPVPRNGFIDPKRFRLRLADLPTGYTESGFGGWPDFCDDGNTLCRSVYGAIGAYGAYEIGFGSNGRPLPITTIQSMAIEGTRTNSRALASLGTRLVSWWNRGGAPKRVPSPARIGQETRVYRGSPLATSYPPGGRFVAYAVEWRDGRVIGQVYVEQQPHGPASAVEALAVNLARTQWRHLRSALGR